MMFTAENAERKHHNTQTQNTGLRKLATTAPPPFLHLSTAFAQYVLVVGGLHAVQGERLQWWQLSKKDQIQVAAGEELHRCSQQGVRQRPQHRQSWQDCK
jgi:hypothetical protein